MRKITGGWRGSGSDPIRCADNTGDPCAPCSGLLAKCSGYRERDGLNGVVIDFHGESDVSLSSKPIAGGEAADRWCLSLGASSHVNGGDRGFTCGRQEEFDSACDHLSCDRALPETSHRRSFAAGQISGLHRIRKASALFDSHSSQTLFEV